MNHEERTLSLDELKDLGRQLLETGKSVNFSLGGTSMFPFLRDGDVGTVFRLPIEALHRGQVLVFEQNGRWIAHRLVAIHHSQNFTRLLCQGDSIIRPDRPIGKDAYLGVLTAFSRDGQPRQLNSFSARSMAWTMVNLRPFPQFFVRLFLRLKKRVFSV